MLPVYLLPLAVLKYLEARLSPSSTPLSSKIPLLPLNPAFPSSPSWSLA